MVNLKRWNDQSLLFSFALFCLYLKIYRIVNFFWKNWLVNEFRTAMGGGLLGISKKFISSFKTWKKILTKFGQFKKLKYPNFVNCPNFVTIFFCVLKMKMIFFYIPSNPLPIAVRNSVVQGRLRKLSILYLESEIFHQYGKVACIHSTPRPRILLSKESRSYEKVRI